MPKHPSPQDPGHAGEPGQPAARPAVATCQLVDAAIELRRQLATLKANLAEVEAALITRGPGKHSGNEDGNVVTVVAAVEGHPGKVAYELSTDSCDAAKELAGAAFGQLFDRHVSYTPCTGFADVVPKLLTPARARDLVALCAKEGKPYAGARAYVKYPAGR